MQPPAARSVEIRRLELTRWDPPDLFVEIVCSKGTYVRSLARDLGEALGPGGTLWELVRTRSGPFSLEEAIPLDAVEAEGSAAWRWVLPPERMVQGLDRLTVGPGEAKALTSGLAIENPEPLPQGDFAILGDDGAVIAVARAVGGALKPVKVFRESVS